MKARTWILALAIVLSGWMSFAQDSAPAAGGGTENREAQMRKVREYVRLQGRVGELFEEKNYTEAIGVCDEMAAAFPDDSTPVYNKACALARLGRTGEALDALAKSIDAGFDDAAHMKKDPDLEPLRAEARFAELAAKARAKQLAHDYEKGQPIEGVKTVEGFPEGGLRYRLRMGPDATAAKPNRLVIWLHPSGGSMNEQAEKMAAPFVARGYALLVLTQKSFLGWTEDDVTKLMDVTLPEVTATPGIDPAKPMLFGYSAGGQVALNLYMEKPDRFGGLILDAAYPVSQTGQGRVAILSPPEAPDAANVPLFVIVGSKDGGAPVWQKAEADWRKAGVPLVLHYVPGKGHTWLFAESQTAALMKWLDQVSAGEKPSGTVGAQAVQKIEPGEPI